MSLFGDLQGVPCIFSRPAPVVRWTARPLDLLAGCTPIRHSTSPTVTNAPPVSDGVWSMCSDHRGRGPPSANVCHNLVHIAWSPHAKDELDRLSFLFDALELAAFAEAADATCAE